MIHGTTTGTISVDAPTAVELRTAVYGGDLGLVRRLLAGSPDLARARFVVRGGSGTALHFVTDWPGYFPNGPDIVHLLVDAGADPNATTTGPGKPESEHGLVAFKREEWFPVSRVKVPKQNRVPLQLQHGRRICGNRPSP